MRASYFMTRNGKEILRDPLTALLGMALPLVFLALFSFIGKNTPVDVFKPANLAPGMMVFGFSFLTMFSALLIAQDKKSSFLMRLFTSPLKPVDYIAGYSLPLIPIALGQIILCLAAAVVFGVAPSWNMLAAATALLPQVLFSIFTGLLLGTLLSVAQVQAVGNIFILFGAILGGAWMDMKMIGGPIEKIAAVLPFAHSIDSAREILTGNYGNLPGHLIIVGAYAVTVFLLSALFFNLKIRKGAD